MTDWRIESFRAWQQMTEQNGQMCIIQNLIFRLFLIIQLKSGDPNKTLDDVDPELLEMYKS
jgi:Fe-S cluster assembly protein SufB